MPFHIYAYKRTHAHTCILVNKSRLPFYKVLMKPSIWWLHLAVCVFPPIVLIVVNFSPPINRSCSIPTKKYLSHIHMQICNYICIYGIVIVVVVLFECCFNSETKSPGYCDCHSIAIKLFPLNVCVNVLQKLHS